ncbi:sigma-54 dependent transcriptional regulator [Photobacterium sp.]|uniref:sigma-54 interaction domain-containing protein n=1 Tax=Photobacterium sp. TaxID=660 RepID=UPI00299DE231|nr:sigma-54 dependent transcriptional regulator [Photobacterium sp.]MDX1302269.1 sigma-54 dependent transcriptional regulator [Photobacterium sp.]
MSTAHAQYYTQSLASALDMLERQTSHTGLLTCWLKSVRQLTEAASVQCFLLKPEGELIKTARANLDGVDIEINPPTLSDTDYDADNALTLCLTERKHIEMRYSQCNETLRHILFTSSERYTLNEGCILLLPLHTQDENSSVNGVLAIYQAEEIDSNDIPAVQSLNGVALSKILQMRSLSKAASALFKIQQQSPPIPSDYGIVGDSDAIKKVRLKISQALHINRNVLVTGETGTGKELVARAIQQSGSRRTQAFCIQNCASIPDHLLESELFGYHKGAFTGANKDYPGLLRSADKGTVFLDEIGDMPLQLQAKLLRVLEDKQVRPLGSTQSFPIDIRIIAATHQHLDKLISEGKFRHDLYYRLAQFPIALPNLKARNRDAVLLANYFIHAYAKEHQTPPAILTEEAEAILLSYSFPGNVRELKNLVDRALIISQNSGAITPELFAYELQSLPASCEDESHHTTSQPIKEGNSFTAQVDDFERQLLTHFLSKYQGNLRAVAQALKLSKGSLDYRMRKFNLLAKDWRDRV